MIMLLLSILWGFGVSRVPIARDKCSVNVGGQVFDLGGIGKRIQKLCEVKEGKSNFTYYIGSCENNDWTEYSIFDPNVMILRCKNLICSPLVYNSYYDFQPIDETSLKKGIVIYANSSVFKDSANSDIYTVIAFRFIIQCGTSTEPTDIELTKGILDQQSNDYVIRYINLSIKVKNGCPARTASVPKEPQQIYSRFISRHLDDDDDDEIIDLDFKNLNHGLGGTRITRTDIPSNFLYYLPAGVSDCPYSDCEGIKTSGVWECSLMGCKPYGSPDPILNITILKKYPEDGLNVRQTIKLPQSSLNYTTNLQLKCNKKLPLGHIYYTKAVDDGQNQYEKKIRLQGESRDMCKQERPIKTNVSKCQIDIGDDSDKFDLSILDKKKMPYVVDPIIPLDKSPKTYKFIGQPCKLTACPEAGRCFNEEDSNWWLCYSRNCVGFGNSDEPPSFNSFVNGNAYEGAVIEYEGHFGSKLYLYYQCNQSASDPYIYDTFDIDGDFDNDVKISTIIQTKHACLKPYPTKSTKPTKTPKPTKSFTPSNTFTKSKDFSSSVEFKPTESYSRSQEFKPSPTFTPIPVKAWVPDVPPPGILPKEVDTEPNIFISLQDSYFQYNLYDIEGQKYLTPMPVVTSNGKKGTISFTYSPFRLTDPPRGYAYPRMLQSANLWACWITHEDNQKYCHPIANRLYGFTESGVTNFSISFEYFGLSTYSSIVNIKCNPDAPEDFDITRGEVSYMNKGNGFAVWNFTVESSLGCAYPYIPFPTPSPPITPTPTPDPATVPQNFKIQASVSEEIKVDVNLETLPQINNQEIIFSSTESANLEKNTISLVAASLIECPNGFDCGEYKEATVWKCGDKSCFPAADLRYGLGIEMLRTTRLYDNPSNLSHIGFNLRYLGGVGGYSVVIELRCDPLQTGYVLNNVGSIIENVVLLQGLTSSVCPVRAASEINPNSNGKNSQVTIIALSVVAALIVIPMIVFLFIYLINKKKDFRNEIDDSSSPLSNKSTKESKIEIAKPHQQIRPNKFTESI